jgi:serine/threonine protein phosphatase 1
MFGKLFGGQREETIAPRAPDGTRVYAVGDVHGRADLLAQINQLIHADGYARQAPRNVVVYLGDYIDRGPASAEVIDLLIDRPLPGFEAVHLLGNHEESLLRFLNDGTIIGAWMSFGGGPTLLSYGVRPPDALAGREVVRAQDELRQRLPERHLRFLRGLQLTHAEGDYFFAHAGIRPGVPLDRQAPEDLLWIRGEFLASPADHGKIVVHGHTITTAPEVRRNRIGIDTGAFASGHLTCLVLEGEEWSFLQT